MSRSIHAVLVVLSALAALPAAAAGPYLVADLDTAPVVANAFSPFQSEHPIEWAELGGFLYFAADDGRHGVELWHTNGSFRGTRMVADLCPGPCSSSPKELIVFKGRLAFNATDGFHGTEIWFSDGTREGTRILLDLCPGSCSAVYPGWTEPVVVGERLFFAGHLPSGGRLGVTDGTAEGTRWLTQPQPQRRSGVSPIGNFKGRLAFSGPSAEWPSSSLWLSDGTPEGTAAAVDLCSSQGPCGAGWADASVVGDHIVFFSWGLPQMWGSDGTADGTRLLGEVPSPPESKILWKGALYFLSSDYYGGGLWRSDGTPQGTTLLRAVPRLARGLTLLGDRLYFIANDGFGTLMLWRSAGTAESTEVFFQPAPGAVVPWGGTLTRVGERIIFPMTSGAGEDFWETDGTAAGTRQVARFRGAGPLSPTSIGRLYLFSLSEAEHGVELWALDGTAVRLVRDIARDPGSGRPGNKVFAPFDERRGRDIAALGGRIVFSAKTAPQGPARLWASDGTAVSTAEMGLDVPWPRGFVQVGDRLWFYGSTASISEPSSGRDLWSTDGTAAGTRSVAEGVDVLSLIGGRPGLILFGGEGLPIFPETWTGVELWASDGTAEGTRLVKDIWTGMVNTPWFEPEVASSYPAHFAPLGNSVLFVAGDGPTGREPWITDGTAAGTRLLLDINPTPTDELEPRVGGSLPGPFVRFGDRAFFAADDGMRGRELWATDGKAAGTALVRDLLPGAAGSNPRDLVQVGSHLFFLADGSAADALWTISAAGQVTRVRLLAKDQRASGLVAVGSRLFFVVDEPATGPELWTSDGTRGGTRKVSEIRPGPLGSYPQELTAVDGRLLFAADDGVHGLELWVSDGTAAGTRLLADLAPGIGASGPRNFTLAGDLVAFDADDGVHGTELWAIRKADIAGVVH